MKWTLVFTKQAQKDAKKLAAAGLKPKAEELLKVLEQNPLQTPPRYGGANLNLLAREELHRQQLMDSHSLVPNVSSSSHGLRGDKQGHHSQMPSVDLSFRRRSSEREKEGWI